MFIAWVCLLSARQISVRQMSVASGARKRTCENCGCDHDRCCRFRRRNRIQKIQSVFARQEQGTRCTAKEACFNSEKTKCYGSREQIECGEIAKAATHAEKSPDQVEASTG